MIANGMGDVDDRRYVGTGRGRPRLAVNGNLRRAGRPRGGRQNGPRRAHNGRRAGRPPGSTHRTCAVTVLQRLQNG